MSKPRHLYRVEWEDSASLGGWRTEEKILKDARTTVNIVSVGYLVRKGKQEIVLCQSYDEQGKINDTISIPVGCVRNIRRITEKKR